MTVFPSVFTVVTSLALRSVPQARLRVMTTVSPVTAIVTDSWSHGRIGVLRAMSRDQVLGQFRRRVIRAGSKAGAQHEAEAGQEQKSEFHRMEATTPG